MADILTNEGQHILLYGPSGAGKSHLAATAASLDNPQLIAAFDSLGNLRPYLEVGPVEALDQVQDGVMVGRRLSVIPTYMVYGPNDKLLRKIWHFGASMRTTQRGADLDIMNPEGIEQWTLKLPLLIKEMQTINSKLFTFDSFTIFTTLARRTARATNLGPPSVHSNDNDRNWNYAITDFFEDICLALNAMRCTTIAIGHPYYNENKNTTGINAPGRMADNTIYMFSDVWYCHIDKDGKHKVLTKGDNHTQAKNSVGAEDICDNDYWQITSNTKPLQWRKRL
jgi:energy-coupling factor transporter ATP-binding protein EcfA2